MFSLVWKNPVCVYSRLSTRFLSRLPSIVETKVSRQPCVFDSMKVFELQPGSSLSELICRDYQAQIGSPTLVNCFSGRRVRSTVHFKYPSPFFQPSSTLFHSNFCFLFDLCFEKEGNEKKMRKKDKAIEKGDYGLPIRNVFLRLLSDLNQAVPIITSQTRVKRARRIHHRPILLFSSFSSYLARCA